MKDIRVVRAVSTAAALLTKLCWWLSDCLRREWRHTLWPKQRASPGWGYSGSHPSSWKPLQRLWPRAKEDLKGKNQIPSSQAEYMCSRNRFVGTYRCEANVCYIVFTDDRVQGKRALSQDLFVARHGRTFLTSFLVQISKHHVDLSPHRTRNIHFNAFPFKRKKKKLTFH